MKLSASDFWSMAMVLVTTGGSICWWRVSLSGVIPDLKRKGICFLFWFGLVLLLLAFVCFCLFVLVLKLISLHFSGKLGLILFGNIHVKMYTSAFGYGAVVFPGQKLSAVAGEEGERQVRNFWRLQAVSASAAPVPSGPWCCCVIRPRAPLL